MLHLPLVVVVVVVCAALNSPKAIYNTFVFSCLVGFSKTPNTSKTKFVWKWKDL
jgi:hypothetical protein